MIANLKRRRLVVELRRYVERDALTKRVKRDRVGVIKAAVHGTTLIPLRLSKDMTAKDLAQVQARLRELDALRDRVHLENVKELLLRFPAMLVGLTLDSDECELLVDALTVALEATHSLGRT